jgi:hypothetical protein
MRWLFVAEVTDLQRRINLTVIGIETPPLLQAGNRSAVKIYRSDPIFDIQPSILPLVTGGGPFIEQKEPLLPVRLAARAFLLLSLLHQIKRSLRFYENETHSTGLTN